jgi:hypothetical protein
MLNDVNLAQVFLWFQEKELLGEGSMLENANPGLNFRAADLVRNLMLSCYMDKPIQLQEKVLREFWLEPFERKVGSNMDTVLSSYLQHKLPKENVKRHVSKIEQICKSA